MSAMQRRKGATAERELCRMLSDHLGDDVIRNLSQSRDGGHDLLGVGRFAVEVKRQEKLSLGTWWNQACEQANHWYRIPVLAYRQSRHPWRFVLSVNVIVGASDILWPDDGMQPYEMTVTLGIEAFAMVVREAGLT